MENEIWKDIVGFEEYYQINNTGDVIAKEYGVSRVTISDVIKRRSWDYDNM